MKLVISCTGLRALQGSGKEFRLVTAWSDLGEPLESTAALDSNTPAITPPTPQGSGLVVSQSPVFQHVAADKPVALPLGGIRLYGPRDPKGDFAMYGLVYEVDKEYEGLADDLANATKGALAQQVISYVAKTAFGPITLAVDLLPRVIKEVAKDDVFGQFQLSGHALNNYSVGVFAEGGKSVTREEDVQLAKAVLRLRYELYDDES